MTLGSGNSMALTPEEIERYKRHLVLREVGGQGQQQLKAAKVLVVGAGGLGSPGLMYLSGAGGGPPGIIDDDPGSPGKLQPPIRPRPAPIRGGEGPGAQ